MKKIAIFGACREGLEVYRSLYAASILGGYDVEFVFLDNDSRLENSDYEGIPVKRPGEFNFNEVATVVIGIIAYDRALKQLLELDVPIAKIIRFYSDNYFSDKPRKIGMASIGKYSYYKPSTILYNVEIGNYCHIGADCRLGLIGHNVNLFTTYPFDYQFGSNKDNLDTSKDPTTDTKKSGKLKIGHDVYIGEGVTIMSGIEIGIGSVVGSKSVVTKDVPPFSVVAGIPAKIISQRLSESERELILSSNWWEYDKDDAHKILLDLLDKCGSK